MLLIKGRGTPKNKMEVINFIRLLILNFVILFFLFSCDSAVDSKRYDISGHVMLCDCGNESVSLTLESSEIGKVEVKSDVSGNYVFNNVWTGKYVVTPHREGYTFYPKSREVFVSNGNIEYVDFDTISSWERAYGDGLKNSGGYSIHESDDCGFLISGYKDVSGTGIEDLDMWILKTDLHGNIVWESTYGKVSSPDFAHGAFIDAHGNVIVGGYIDSLESGAMAVLKYIPHLGEWTLSGGFEKVYGTADLPEKPAYIFETSDFGYFFCGYSGGTIGNLEDVYGVKTDSSGVVLNEVHYGTGGGELSKSGTLIVNDESFKGGFLLVGETFNELGQSAGLMLKRESNLDEVWSKTFSATDDSTSLNYFSTTLCSVKETPDNGYIAAGSLKRYSFSTRDVYLLKTDSSGNEEWNRKFDFGSDDCNARVIVTSDGGYALALSYLSLGSSTYCIKLLKFDSLGEIQWERNFDGGFDGSLYVHDFICTYDGGFAICGEKELYKGMGQAYVIKTDSNGEIH